IPSRVSISSRWSLVYSLDQHGASLNTLYQKCKESSGPCLLVIRDSYGETFGAYLTESIHKNSSFYGTGECFLWNKQAQKVCLYSWTSKNNHMIYSDQDILAIGNGEGGFGLCLHSDLLHGYTEPCATFDNPALTVTNAFECIGLEIWSFLY
ncbi:TLD-domain-containing protein, partial [Rhizopus microsporus ATCC 52813]